MFCENTIVFWDENTITKLDDRIRGVAADSGAAMALGRKCVDVARDSSGWVEAVILANGSQGGCRWLIVANGARRGVRSDPANAVIEFGAR